MTINTELLEQTMTYIEAHPYQHDQNWWRCGTARCFAGWASFLAGGRFISSEEDKTHIVAANGVKNFRASTIRTPDGELLHVGDHAVIVLGVDEFEADIMFEPGNSIADLRRMVDNLVEFGTIAGDSTPRERAAVPQ